MEGQRFGHSYAKSNSTGQVGAVACFPTLNEPVTVDWDDRTSNASHIAPLAPKKAPANGRSLPVVRDSDLVPNKRTHKH